MTLTRRDAIRISGSTLAGLSLAKLGPDDLLAQSAPQEAWPQELVERPLREGFPAALPLEADGSAPEHPASAAGSITEPYMWRYTDRQAPQIEFDYRLMKVKVDPRGLAKMGGTLTFDDLEPLPRVSGTFLLQCGAPNPTGIVKWTGVRVSDFLDLLEPVEGAHYARFVASDRYYVDEDIRTLRHPQVLLAWLMNDEPIPPQHGAPLRLIMPFRYGARSIKAIQEIYLGTPGLPQQPLPV